MSAREAKLTFREAVEEFEDAVSDQALLTADDGCVRVTEALYAAKARLLAFDPANIPGTTRTCPRCGYVLDAHSERDAEDRYAEEHEFDVPIELVQPEGESRCSMVDYANRVLRGPVGEDGGGL